MVFMDQCFCIYQDQLMVSANSKSRFILPGIAPKPKRRPARVADTIKNEIGLLLLYKINDPRVQQVTITDVTVTDDLRRARIYYSVLEEEKAKDAVAGLASAKGFMRSHLAKELGMRYVPDLEFKRDLAMSHREDMERLFKELGEEDEPAS